MAELTNPQVQKGDTEASIDSVNQWMRVQPWYQQALAAWGQNPARTKLTEDQRKQLVKLAQAHGVRVDEGNIEVDPGGNFNPKGHKLRNTLIVAGIVGASLATAGLAGAFSGAAAGTGAGVGAAGAAAPLASTGTIGLGTLASAAPSSLMAAGGSAAALAPVAAGVGTAAGVAGATGAGSSLWGKIAGPLIGAAVPAAAGLIGTKMEVDANKKAAELQAQAAEQALQWEKEQYGVRQRQLAPTIGVGNAATLRLGDLMGLQAPQGGYQAPPETQPTPAAVPAQAVQRAPTATPAEPMVAMLSPTGAPGQVPQSMVQAALAKGATLVQQQGA